LWISSITSTSSLNTKLRWDPIMAKELPPVEVEVLSEKPLVIAYVAYYYPTRFMLFVDGDKATIDVYRNGDFFSTFSGETALRSAHLLLVTAEGLVK
jgi:hypothetical protein